MTDRPLRVLLLYWGRRGAAQRYSLDLAQHWASDGSVDLHVSLSTTAEVIGSFEAMGLPGLPVETFETVRQLVTRTPGLFKLRRRVHRYIQDHQIDVVFCPMIHPWNPIVQWRIPRPIVTVAHDPQPLAGDRSWGRREIEWWSLRQADAVIALSDLVAHQLTGRLKIASDRVHRLTFCALPRRADRHPAVVKSGAPRVLFIGRIKPYKGIDLLLGATERLRQAGQSFTLRIAGDGDWARHQGEIERLGHIETVNRWLSEDEVDAEVAQADIIVLPYRAATQSGVVSVAAAHGIRLVATPVGGLPEQLAEIPDSILATAATEAAFADALALAISQTGTQRARHTETAPGDAPPYDPVRAFADHAKRLKAVLSTVTSGR